MFIHMSIHMSPAVPALLLIYSRYCLSLSCICACVHACVRPCGRACIRESVRVSARAGMRGWTVGGVGRGGGWLAQHITIEQTC